MEIKLGLLGVRLVALSGITSQKTGGVLAYNLNKIRDKVEDEERAFQKARIALCEIYAEKDKDGKPIIRELDGRDQYIGLDSNELFNKEMNELLNESVKIEGSPLGIKELERKGIQLSADDIRALGELVKMEEE